MAKAKKSQFGELPPKYSFVLNPYPDMRVGRCPYCEHKTGQRKIPLLIHVKPMHLIALNYTCRYCRTCDLLIADKHTIEHWTKSPQSKMTFARRHMGSSRNPCSGEGCVYERVMRHCLDRAKGN